MDIDDPAANQTYRATSDAFAQIVHLNKSLIEYSYPGLRSALGAFARK